MHWLLGLTHSALCRSLVVGIGSNPPLRVANEAASCPAAPATCDYVSPHLQPCQRWWPAAGSAVHRHAGCGAGQGAGCTWCSCACLHQQGLTRSLPQTTAYLTSAPNPNVLYGALPAGANNTDNYVDVRTNANSQVQLDFTAGVAGVLAGLEEAPGSWEQCLQVRPLLAPAAAALTRCRLRALCMLHVRVRCACLGVVAYVLLACASQAGESSQQLTLHRLCRAMGYSARTRQSAQARARWSRSEACQATGWRTAFRQLYERQWESFIFRPPATALLPPALLVEVDGASLVFAAARKGMTRLKLKAWALPSHPRNDCSAELWGQQRMQRAVAQPLLGWPALNQGPCNV